MWVWSLGQEDPLEKEMATHSSTLAWEIPWTEEPGGLQSRGCKEPVMIWWLNNNTEPFVHPCSCCLLVVSYGENHYQIQLYEDFSPIFSSKSLIVSGLTFRFLIHFELVLCKWCEVRIQLPFLLLLHVDIQFSQHHVLKTLSQAPPLPSRLLHGLGQGSLCCAVGPCWLFILSIAMCTCPSPTPL